MNFNERAEYLRVYLQANNYQEVAKIIGSCEDSKELILYARENETEKTALHYLAEYGSWELHELVFSDIEDGDNIDVCSSNNETPLMFAAQRDNSDILKFYLTHGGNTNKHDLDGKSPLHYAILAGCNLEIVECLVDYGANVNWTSWDNEESGTPLLLAVKHESDEEIIEYLLQCGADVNEADACNETPLHYGVFENCYDIFQLLVKYGAKALTMNDSGLTVGHELISHWLPNTSPIEPFNLLIENQAIDMSIQDINGNTFLHTLLEYGHIYPEIAEYFIMNGTDINLQNNHGDTCLHVLANFMCRYGTTDETMQILNKFIEYGANLCIMNQDGKTYSEILNETSTPNIRRPFVLGSFDELGDDKECPVCMELMKMEDVLGRCPQCKKSFHNTCLIRLREDKCPTCRLNG